ncbi:hypothetical protein FY557_17575 [Chryseobacterium sp. SN22]|uniref:hypothetical protein n=1 Tax=Chryseobacterium sp. SN22 TaxID=2606431 RepID=UPI0011EDD154|nr:hypothetical protein [Chryseobacterium sp. SN22]KAA0126460.1 hypothetical protein FY557_17575 [Chryseobacterium sp. SN22]
MDNLNTEKRVENYVYLIKKNSELFEGKDHVNTSEFNEKDELIAFIIMFKIQGEEDNFYNIYTTEKIARLRDFCGKIVLMSEIENNSGKIPIISI